MRTTPCDVFIVGAGPAGLAAAIALRLRGADVLVADALPPPIDKPCGEGLLPDARHALAALGVSPEACGAPFTGITFASEHSHVSAGFPDGSGLGIRRTTLCRLLYERASALGVRIAFGIPVILQPDQPPSLAGRQIAARWIIGADGVSSRVRAWARLDTSRLLSRRFGFRAHFRLAPGIALPAHVEVHWGPLGQAYITPTGPAEICVSAMTHRANLRFHQILSAIPSLATRLASASPLSAERGCLTITRHLRRVTRGNIALLGDASGSVDAITGEGLALAFRQALLLAGSLAAGDLALYQSGHAALLRLPQRMASLLLLLDRHPRLCARTLRAFAARPQIFSSLLAVHVGAESLSRFLLCHGPALAAALATPSRQPPPVTPLSTSSHFSETPLSD